MPLKKERIYLVIWFYFSLLCHKLNTCLFLLLRHFLRPVLAKFNVKANYHQDRKNAHFFCLILMSNRPWSGFSLFTEGYENQRAFFPMFFFQWRYWGEKKLFSSHLLLIANSNAYSTDKSFYNANLKIRKEIETTWIEKKEPAEKLNTRFILRNKFRVCHSIEKDEVWCNPTNTPHSQLHWHTHTGWVKNGKKEQS